MYRRSKKWALAAVIFGVTTAIAEPEPSNPAASVNGVSIERGDLQQLVQGLARGEPSPPDRGRIDELTQSALDSLIDLELLVQEAGRTKTKVSSEEIDREVEKTRRHFGSQAEFTTALTQRGLTPDRLNLDTKRTLLATRLLERGVWRDITVDREEVDNFYQQNRAQLSSPLADLRESIIRVLREEKRAKARAELVKDLRSKAKIELFPPFRKLANR